MINQEKLNALNDRELEIIALLGEGLTNTEIADRLFLAPSTIKWYVRQLNRKLGTSNRNEILEITNDLRLLHTPREQPVYLRPRHNLPRQTTPFIGRDAELDEIHALLEQEGVRLLTILAPGGMGKTRIALEATEQQRNHFPDGVYYVSLQSLSDVGQIMPQIAHSAGFTFSDDERTPEEQVLDFLSNKTMLLCIDNWEHLLDGVSLVNDILTHAPKVKVIATSREKLNLLGETVYHLHGMKFPAWETPEDALRYDAVQLLVQSARRVKPDWKIEEDNLDYVTRVCRLTQGMPLGILLAVSWLDVYPLDLICEEIQKSADILETDMRDIPDRQRSIRAIFEYSWARLSEEEQNTLAKLSIFRGGFSPRAALAVTGANARILQNLMNKALIMRDKTGRYDIHELLMQYTHEKFSQSGDVEALRDAHMRYYMNALAEQQALLRDSRIIDAINSIRIDFENVRLAWERACIKRDYDLLENVVTTFTLFLTFSGISRRVADEVIVFAREHLTDDALQGHPQAIKVARHVQLDRWQQRFDLAQKSLDLALTNDDFREAGMCLIVMSEHAAYAEHDFEKAFRFGEEAVKHLRKIDDQFDLCWCIRSLTLQLGRSGRFDEAEPYLQEASDLAESISNPILIADVMNALSGVRGYAGDLEALVSYATRSIEAASVLPFTLTLPLSMSLKSQGLLYMGQVDDAYAIVKSLNRVVTDYDVKLGLGIAAAMTLYVHATRGDYDAAWALLDDAIAGMGQHPDFKANSVFLGITALGIGKTEQAKACFRNGVYAGRHAKSDYILLHLLIIPAVILTRENERIRATELAGLLYNHPASFTRFLDVLPMYQKLIADLRHQIGDDTFECAWKQGTTLDLPEVIDEFMVTFGVDIQDDE